jgi:hypothetical protein
MHAPEQLVAVHVNGMTYSFSRGNSEAGSVYGGPLERSVGGCTFGPARLHQVASLSASSLPILGAPRYVFELPLVYGFRFDGCSLEYRFQTNEIEVLRISPEISTEGWPYPDYPALLPYIPIEAALPTPQDWEAFASGYPNLPDEQPAELVAVVPPAFLIGQSLWGRGGDLEGVCVVFECDLSEKKVRSYNVCG